MYTYSYWEQELFFDQNDLIIIGSGIVGLGAAYFFKKINPQKNVLILERGPIPAGASTRNAGFACYGSLGEISDNLRNHTLEDILSLMKRRYMGLKLLRNTLGDTNIDFYPCGSYELFDNELDYNYTTNFLDLINEAALDFLPDKPYQLANYKIHDFGFNGIKYLIFNRFEGALNSGKVYWTLLKMCLELGIKILNGIEVTRIDSVTKKLFLENDFSFTFNNLLICTNAFTRKLLPQLDISPGRGLVLVSKPIEGLKLNGIFHFQKGYFYFRNIGKRLLIGGGRNLDFEGEQTTVFGTNPTIKDALLDLAKTKIIPYAKFEPEFEWSGIMAFGNDKNPIVTKISDSIFCAVRMGGMGVAIGLQIAKEAVELVNNEAFDRGQP